MVSVPVRKVLRELPGAIDEGSGEHHRGYDQYYQQQQRVQDRRQARTAVQTFLYLPVPGIGADGNDGAPDDGRDERLDDLEAQYREQQRQANPNGHVECAGDQYFQIVSGLHGMTPCGVTVL